MEEMPQPFLPQLKYSGLAAIIGGWLVILVSISQNSWFRITQHAFSDLGNPAASSPWIFNYGMMINGLLVIIYGLYLTDMSFNKASKIGGRFTVMTGVFLILIGLFPEGSQYHYIVSIWFFAQGGITILTWGLALFVVEKWKKTGITFLVLSILGSILAFIIPWPSVALAEACGIIIINIWVLMMMRINSGFDAEALYLSEA